VKWPIHAKVPSGFVDCPTLVVIAMFRGAPSMRCTGRKILRHRYYRQYPNSRCSWTFQLSQPQPILRIFCIHSPFAAIFSHAPKSVGSGRPFPPAGMATVDDSQPLWQQWVVSRDRRSHLFRTKVFLTRLKH
jgi:hypothetical protein